MTMHAEEFQTLSDRVSFIPKWYVGLRFKEKLCFSQAEATKLRGHLRSQVQLGSEEKR